MSSDVAISASESIMASVFGRETQTVKIKFPTDKIGFWLTQVLPLTLFFAHILLSIVDQRFIGRCFVPNIQGKHLSKDQVSYITEYCVDQATDFECFLNDSVVKPICKTTGKLCSQLNGTLPSPQYFNDANGDDDEDDELADSSIWGRRFFYRNYVWFLLILAFVRCVPHQFFTFFCTADIATIMEDFRTNYERVHGKERLGDKPVTCTAEEKRRATCLFMCYFAQKMVELVFDVLFLLGVLAFAILNRTMLTKNVFVCDLHADRDNLFLCDTMKTRFVSCSISFGFEFLMTIIVVVISFSMDMLVQSIFALSPLVCNTSCCKKSTPDKKPNQQKSTPQENPPNYYTKEYSSESLYLMELWMKQNKPVSKNSSS